MSDQADLFNRPPPSNGSATSDAAAAAIAPSADALRALVLVAHRNAGAVGLTEHEGCAVTRIAPNTYRPRRRELTQAGLLVETQMRRPSSPGSRRTAAAWVAKEHHRG